MSNYSHQDHLETEGEIYLPAFLAPRNHAAPQEPHDEICMVPPKPDFHQFGSFHDFTKRNKYNTHYRTSMNRLRDYRFLDLNVLWTAPSKPIPLLWKLWIGRGHSMRIDVLFQGAHVLGDCLGRSCNFRCRGFGSRPIYNYKPYFGSLWTTPFF